MFLPKFDSNSAEILSASKKKLPLFFLTLQFAAQPAHCDINIHKYTT